MSLIDNWTRIFVKGRGDTNRWLMIGEQYPQAKITVNGVYGFLNSIGQTWPGSVRELSIFAHAHIGGPILRNSFDLRPPYEHARDAGNDTDPRSKDFDLPNLEEWPQMPQAFASPSAFHVWGCNKSVRVVRMAAMSNTRQSAPDTFFIAVSEDVKESSYEESTTPNITCRLIFQMLVSASYTARAASWVSKSTVFGSAPGSWARMSQDQFWVPWNDSSTGDLTSFQAMRAWYERELGTEFALSKGLDGEGYLDFSRLATQLVPSVVPTSRYYQITRSAEHGFGITFFEFPLRAPRPPGITNAAVRAAMVVSPEEVPQAAVLATGATPPVKPSERGTLYRISSAGVPVAAYLVVEDTDLNGLTIAVRVFRMRMNVGQPNGVDVEERPEHRVELVTKGPLPKGQPVRVRYWSLSGGSADAVVLAPVGSANHVATRVASIASPITGEIDINIDGLPPGTYVARVFENGITGILMGESHDRFTLLP